MAEIKFADGVAYKINGVKQVPVRSIQGEERFCDAHVVYGAIRVMDLNQAADRLMFMDNGAWYYINDSATNVALLRAVCAERATGVYDGAAYDALIAAATVQA